VMKALTLKSFGLQADASRSSMLTSGDVVINYSN
jgi:hypothetical protein